MSKIIKIIIITILIFIIIKNPKYVITVAVNLSNWIMQALVYAMNTFINTLKA